MLAELPVKMLVEVVVELEVDVALDLTTKPWLVRVLLMKPGGFPVDTNWPFGSESWNSKLGLTDNAASSTLSPLPIVHV